MLYKEDWEETKKRYEQWWNGEIIDRVVIQVTANRKNPIKYEKEMPKPADVVKMWSDPEYFIYKHEKNFAKTFFV